ncbi:hypothetical protein K474DRAFT_1684749 [Panus rudis PR-1116 ss-1]|nr:hypothetical protein K474DRAFT_1684749 [Panus rudis PR-1116 ss-1]
MEQLKDIEQEKLQNTPCAICRRQFARYTCPRCNVPYCSLVCFRSGSHAECSESFYKKELEDDIRSEPSKSTEERRQMMELLKRFEEESLEDDALLDDEDDEDDFTSRFKNMDLENASYDELWAALTPAERDKFMKALNDPSSELAQTLLTSEELERQKIEPWWEAPADIEPSDDTPSISPLRYGHKPRMMSIPEAVVKAAAANANTGPSLLYNLCSVLPLTVWFRLAYAYVTRHFATSPISSLDPQDPDREDARKTISRLVPFLTDKKSKVLMPNLTAVVTDLWSRAKPGSITPKSMSILLTDVVKLLRPSAITVVTQEDQSHDSPSPYECHPSSRTLLALSDLSSLFTSPTDGSPNHITHKLTFYAARVLSTPAFVLNTVSDEVKLRAKRVEREDAQTHVRKEAPSRPIELENPIAKNEGIVDSGAAFAKRRPKIEEIS